MVLSAVARADAPADDASARERIRAERAAAEATYVQQVQACSTNFVVTSCVDEARAKRHAALTRLDRQQLMLDEALRAQRSTERLEAIDSKVSGEEARRREEAARDRSANRRDTEEPKPVALPPSAVAPRPARAASDNAQRAAQEARARRAYELKQLQAEAHRQEVERRNQERARKANPGAPLPLPAASTGSAASGVLPKTDGPAR
jgi:colicin import membrane protein